MSAAAQAFEEIVGQKKVSKPIDTYEDKEPLTPVAATFARSNKNFYGVRAFIKALNDAHGAIYYSYILENDSKNPTKPSMALQTADHMTVCRFMFVVRMEGEWFMFIPSAFKKLQDAYDFGYKNNMRQGLVDRMEARDIAKDLFSGKR